MPILKHILVATDLSPAGQRAAMRAGQLARQWETSLDIVHVRPDWKLYARWRPASNDGFHAVSHSADALLPALQARLESEFGVHARCDSRLGRASEAIAATVSEKNPNLIVIGARGEHAPAEGKPDLGGTALKLLTRFEQPLLLVRNSNLSVYVRSLVGVGATSALARRLVLWGTDLVKGGGQCRIINVYEAPYVARLKLHGVPSRVIEAQSKQAFEAAMTTLAEVKGAATGDAAVELRAVQGEAVSALLGEVNTYHPHLVVLGKQRSPGSAALGSVVFRVAYSCPADVLLLS